ncbi:MAG: DUF1028 domain-containing protein [Planctomycetota bacterium]|nr:DUF1028 domain-containing protein [Planctomycetaceae bacterium]MDQ3330022.1 DUF1028 domain-containing protein [Planctomycetota bacterium]
MVKLVPIVACCLLVAHSTAFATWSIVAADLKTRQVVVASATCLPRATFERLSAKGLMDIQAIVVPGVGVAVAQAEVDTTRTTQKLIFAELSKGTPPSEILELLRQEERFDTRQFGIVDLRGRHAASTGEKAQTAAVDMHERIAVTDLVFSIQGNILASDDVVYQAARAFREGNGDLVERTMRAMEAADREGGDRRCTCATPPKTAATADCTHKTAHVAYLLVANVDDASGESYNDGEYTLFIDVNDQNIEPHENANPVKTLRMRYDACVAKNQGR